METEFKTHPLRASVTDQNDESYYTRIYRDNYEQGKNPDLSFEMTVGKKQKANKTLPVLGFGAAF